MESKKALIQLKIRHFDTSEIPDVITKHVHFDVNLDYNDLKKELQSICEISPEDNKVIKLRRSDEVLVPLSCLLESNDPENHFFLDVCRINYPGKTNTNLLQDAYIDSVCQKLRNMESRIVKAELLLPQLEWRRQAHMEEAVDGMSTKVAFLNRRIDDLLPPEWKAKMPESLA